MYKTLHEKLKLELHKRHNTLGCSGRIGSSDSTNDTWIKYNINYHVLSYCCLASFFQYFLI